MKFKKIIPALLLLSFSMSSCAWYTNQRHHPYHHHAHWHGWGTHRYYS